MHSHGAVRNREMGREVRECRGLHEPRDASERVSVWVWASERCSCVLMLPSTAGFGGWGMRVSVRSRRRGVRGGVR
eukprot:4348346-Prymnesium_polylepis.2